LATSGLESVAEQMLLEGASIRDIERMVKNHVNATTLKFYKKAHDPEPIKNCINVALRKDSRAEVSVAQYLLDGGIDYKFQFPIGPYRADFLLGGCVVLEVDGPHHKNQVEYDANRDKYIQKMGYRVIRIPISIFTLSPEAVVCQLKEEIYEQKTEYAAKRPR
jgi:very-short-patch-repair endonuclease